MKDAIGTVFAGIILLGFLVTSFSLLAVEQPYILASPLIETPAKGVNSLPPELLSLGVLSVPKTTDSGYDCGYFEYTYVPDGERKYFPEDSFARINSKMVLLNEIAREENVPTLALLFVWWKEGAKGTGWSFWRASLRNTEHNTDGVVGMTDNFFKSDFSVYSKGVVVTDEMLAVQFRDAAKVLQVKAKNTVSYGSRGFLIHSDGALDLTTLLAVEAYNGLTYRQQGVSSPYIYGRLAQEGFDGYIEFVRIMNLTWIPCQ